MTMHAINAIFDETGFRPIEPIPVKGKYEAIIIFTKPIVDSKESIRQSILEHAGTWDDEDVALMEEIVKERTNFSINRQDEMPDGFKSCKN